MLPKEEKIKKGSDLEQPGLFDKENEKERIAKKRKVIYIAMILTIGLSLSFWIYRSIRNFNFSFKLPEFNFTVSKPKFSKINLPQDSASWSVFLKRVDTNSIIYQTSDNVFFDDQQLNNIDYIDSSVYSSSLPEGLKIKELVEEKDNNIVYVSKIISPNQELILIIKIDDSKDLSQSKNLLPGLIGQLYWYSLQK